MIRALYNWTMSLAEHPRAVFALAAIAFIEASVFPIPPDVLLIPMIIAAPQRAWLFAMVATVSSVLGGLAGYMIGAFAFTQVGEPILMALGKADAMATFATRFNEAGFWTVLTAGLTPFPFKVITILSGATAMPLPLFIGSAILARAARFFLVALLLWKFGAPIRVFIEKYLGWVALVGIAVLLGGFLGVGYL